MEKTKLISIILPVYNGEKYIKQSIESCLNQTYENIELIIVNDCSTDGTLDIINKYVSKDSRVRVINNIENKKLPASLNIGHNEANGDFLTWTSDDNFYELNAIEFLHQSLVENNKDLAYSNITVITENGAVKREVQYAETENLLFGNNIGSCFLYKKEVFIRNNGYNESLLLVEDYDFWLRASLHSLFFHIDKSLYNYRLHDNSLTNSIHNNIVKNELWKTNVTKMYSDFVYSILGKKNEIISQFQTKILTYQKIEFSWIENNFHSIEYFIDKTNSFSNYKNKSKLEIVFLKQILHVLISGENTNGNIRKSFFILKKYYQIMDWNTFKTLIKYSLFK